jgi:hypothetical protein
MATNAESVWKAQAEIEWALWQRLMTLLVLFNAVTADDLKARTGSADTNGQRLINVIREWGEARATLSLAHAAYKKEKPDG